MQWKTDKRCKNEYIKNVMNNKAKKNDREKKEVMEDRERIGENAERRMRE